MATTQMNTVVRHIRRSVLLKDRAGGTGGELLDDFIDQEDEAAFEALVPERHRECAERHRDCAVWFGMVTTSVAGR